MSQLFSETRSLRSRDLVIDYAAFGITVSRPFSIAVEVLLVVVACSAVILLCAIIRSTSNLTSDPDNIKSLFPFIQNADTIISHLSSKENLTEKSLNASIRSDRYHLEATNGVTGPILRLLSSGGGTGSGRNLNSVRTLVSRTETQSIRPKELRPTIGVTFILILAFAMGILVYLKHQEISLRGMNDSSEITQLSTWSPTRLQ